MDATLAWTGTSPDELAEMFERLQETLPAELESAAEDIGVRVRGAAQRNAPVDRNRLRSDIDHVVEQVAETIIRVQIGSNLDYARPIEEGTDPFFPPPSELRGWAGRVLGDEDLAWPVAQSISETGIDEQPYLRPAVEDNLEWFLDRIVEAVEAAFEEAGLT